MVFTQYSRYITGNDGFKLTAVKMTPAAFPVFMNMHPLVTFGTGPNRFFKGYIYLDLFQFRLTMSAGITYTFQTHLIIGLYCLIQLSCLFRRFQTKGGMEQITAVAVHGQCLGPVALSGTLKRRLLG